MGAIVTLITKDLRLLARDRLGFFFTFFFPLIYAVFFGVLFSGTSKGPSAVRVVVVNEDQTAGAADFVAGLGKGGTLELDMAADRAAANDLVRRGARAAYLVIPAGFGEAGRRVFWGDPMRLEIGVDPGQGMAAAMIEGLVTARAYEQVQKLFSDPQAMRDNLGLAREEIRSAEGVSPLRRMLLEGMLSSIAQVSDQIGFGAGGIAASQPGAESRPGGGWQPVRIETTKVTRAGEGGRRWPRSSFAICFPQGILWGVLACAATFAGSLLVERTRGTLPRLMVAPLQRWQILAGKGGACFVATAGLMALLLVVARIAFGVRPDSVLLLTAAVVCVSVGIVGLMMVFSVVGKTESAVNGISWALIVVMAMFGGGMLPLMMMPPWMQTLSHVSPVKWAILALEGAIWRGFSPAEMALPCGVLLLVGVVGSGIGAVVFRCGEGR